MFHVPLQEKPFSELRPQMPIIFQSSDSTFFLQTPRSTYAFAIHPQLRVLVHRFWGKKIVPSDLSYLSPTQPVIFSPAARGLEGYESLDLLPQELPSYGHGDFRASALTIGQQDGSRLLDLRYREHRMIEGKPTLPGLPATYVESPDEAETLEIDLVDEMTGITVTLSYTVFRDFDAIARSLRIRNGGDNPVQVLNAASASVDFLNDRLDVLHLSGAWARERHINRQRVLPSARLSTESRRGTSSHQHHPFLALLDPDAGETTGEVFGLSLVYSGSFSASVESDQFGRARGAIGLNPDEFSWHLEPGETFQTPEAVLVFSAEGLGGMSRTFHSLYRTRLARGMYRDQPRPCLLNNWEATYFDFDEGRLVELARKAGEQGIELFVLDDGWFGKRNDDQSSLGDWVVDRQKLPDGLGALAQKINALGLKFGLWFEPEMVSPDSELYRAHPDWCLHVAGRSRSLGRNQLVLDLSRAEVCDYVIESIAAVLESAPIEYVKWDMNRHLTEVGSPGLPAHRQREVGHRYVLGLYRVMEALITRFPTILFEGCSGGGGRFDPGILHYMPQSWASDNSDAISRLKIQYGTSLVYPWSSIAAHVSAVPNHQNFRITPLSTRFHVALTGAFGYELDLEKLSPHEISEIKQQIAFFKDHRELLANGSLYRLRDPFQCNEAAWMIVASDRSEALTIHVNIQVEANQAGPLLRLQGLEPKVSYEVSGHPQPVNGDVLMNVGLMIPAPKGDFISHCWFLKRASDTTDTGCLETHGASMPANPPKTQALKSPTGC